MTSSGWAVIRFCWHASPPESEKRLRSICRCASCLKRLPFQSLLTALQWRSASTRKLLNRRSCLASLMRPRSCLSLRNGCGFSIRLNRAALLTTFLALFVCEGGLISVPCGAVLSPCTNAMKYFAQAFKTSKENPLFHSLNQELILQLSISLQARIRKRVSN